MSVVEILKYSPQHVRLVCARKRVASETFTSQQEPVAASGIVPVMEGVNDVAPGSERLIKVKIA